MRWSRKKMAVCTVAAVLAATGTVVGATSSASATSLGCRSLNLAGGSYDSYYRDASLGTYYSDLTKTVADRWSAASGPSNLRYSGSTSASIKIYRAFYSAGAYAQTVWTCTNYTGTGTFISRTIQYNRNSMDSFLLWQDKFVITHEFGHAQGLGHNSLGCGVSIMYSDALVSNTSCSGGNPPWSNDISEMNRIY